MDSVAPTSHESTALVLHSSMDTSPDSTEIEVAAEVEFTLEEAVAELGQKIPEVEDLCETIRRCYGATLENLYVSRNRLKILKASNDKSEDTRAAVMEFLYAIDEVKKVVEQVTFSAHQTEKSTEEMVKGARQMTKIF